MALYAKYEWVLCTHFLLPRKQDERCDNVQVIKRDGRKVEFDSSKIESAIKKATHKTGDDINEEFILSILDFIKNQNKDFTVEQIQDVIVKKLMCSRYKKTAEEYIKYREKRTSERNKNNVVQYLQWPHSCREPTYTFQENY